MHFSELAKSRYSVRSYKDLPLPEETLDMILEAGRVAPTAHNSQPQMIYIARSRESREKLASVCRCTFGAPLILVVGYDRNRERASKLNPGLGFGETDTAIVCTHMMLQAADLGIGSCWVGMFNREQVSQILDLPENIVVTALLTLGYPTDDAQPLHLHLEYRDRSETVAEI